MQRFTPVVQRLLRAIGELSSSATYRDLFAVYQRYPVAIDDILPWVIEREDEYRRELLLDGGTFHAWIITWLEAQQSPIHNYKNPACAVRVLSGTLTETVFVPKPDGSVRPESSDYCVGDVIGGFDTDIHRESNLGNARVTSLHVYMPGIIDMDEFIFDARFWSRWIMIKGKQLHFYLKRR